MQLYVELVLGRRGSPERDIAFMSLGRSLLRNDPAVRAAVPYRAEGYFLELETEAIPPEISGATEPERALNHLREAVRRHCGWGIVWFCMYRDPVAGQAALAALCGRIERIRFDQRSTLMADGGWCD